MDKEMKDKILEIHKSTKSLLKPSSFTFDSLIECLCDRIKEHFPEAFEEEKQFPKVGEVWEVKGENKILLIIYACVESNEINAIKIDPIQEYFWFTYKLGRIEFKAKSLEEYYRIKFEKKK